VAGLLGEDREQAEALAAVIAGTEAMSAPHPGLTNRDVFNDVFREMTGVDLAESAASSAIDAFYDHEFPALRATHAPCAGARRAVDTARDLGLAVALATNPIFPRKAVRERAEWAGFALDEFDLVTTYEVMEACKPQPTYYRSVAERLDVSPADCVMVGDDPVLDLAAADVGMKTFYVGPRMQVTADWRGSLDDLADLLPRIVP
jgi:HAD superfamily hydrolase (TIGR01509 family)